MARVTTLEGDTPVWPAALADHPRVEELHTRLRALAAELGFKVVRFRVVEDRYSGEFPQVDVELIQGPQLTPVPLAVRAQEQGVPWHL